MCCLCLCKDTNFLANHNCSHSPLQASFVVYASAKILIFQQITTESLITTCLTSCLCLCKDTNFLANHNCRFCRHNRRLVVYASAKILIFQQITTGNHGKTSPNRCLCLCKDTIFLANHNVRPSGSLDSWVVYASAKILIFQQITTEEKCDIHIIGCLCLCKDTNFLANHNMDRTCITHQRVVYASAKILIFQQITTTVAPARMGCGLFMPLQRY